MYAVFAFTATLSFFVALYLIISIAAVQDHRARRMAEIDRQHDELMGRIHRIHRGED
jgi:hypothetical protein